MTFIELLVFVIRIALSVGIAFGIGQPFGWLVGVPAGMIAFAAFPKISDLVVACFPQGRGKPVCSNGVCESNAYEWVGERDSFPVCQCKCGMKFIHKGTSFEIINEDGTTTLYREWNRKHGWVAPSQSE
jgi:hypothetical protein